MSGLLLLAAIASPFAFTLVGVYLMRSHNIRQADRERRFYALTFPDDLQLEQVIDWLASVNSAMPPGHWWSLEPMLPLVLVLLALIGIYGFIFKRRW